METYKSAPRLSWFSIFQIALGGVCLVLSIVVVFYGAKTAAGAYTWLFLTGIGIIILGLERVISGLYAKGVKTSSRLINIAVGGTPNLFLHPNTGTVIIPQQNSTAYHMNK